MRLEDIIEQYDEPNTSLNIQWELFEKFSSSQVVTSDKSYKDLIHYEDEFREVFCPFRYYL